MRRVLFVFSCALLGASSSFAFSHGPLQDHTGENGTSCTQCHGTNTPAPGIAVTGLEGPFSKGDTAHLTLTVTGGQAAAGFEAGTDSGGTFVVTGGGVQLTKTDAANNNEVEHNTPQSYTAGVATWTFDLTQLVGGSHTLFVAANDVNLNAGTSGDRVGTSTFAFTVAEGEGEGGGGEGEGEGSTPAGGCSESGSAEVPTGALLLLGLALVNRRRR